MYVAVSTDSCGPTEKAPRRARTDRPLFPLCTQQRSLSLFTPILSLSDLTLALCDDHLYSAHEAWQRTTQDMVAMPGVSPAHAAPTTLLSRPLPADYCLRQSNFQYLITLPKLDATYFLLVRGTCTDQNEARAVLSGTLLIGALLRARGPRGCHCAHTRTRDACSRSRMSRTDLCG